MSILHTGSQAGQYYSAIANAPDTRAGTHESIFTCNWMKETTSSNGGNHFELWNLGTGFGRMTHGGNGTRSCETKVGASAGTWDNETGVSENVWHMQCCQIIPGIDDGSTTQDEFHFRHWVDGVSLTVDFPVKDHGTENAAWTVAELCDFTKHNGSGINRLDGLMAHTAIFKIASTTTDDDDRKAEYEADADLLTGRLLNGGLAVRPDAIDITTGISANSTVTLVIYWTLFDDVAERWNPVVGSATLGTGGDAGGGTWSSDDPTMNVIVNVGLASETDTAIAIPRIKNVPVGLATETDTAFTIAVVADVTVNVVTATETDTAIAIPRIKNIALGLASETDTALAIPANKSVALTLATETDTAFAIPRIKNIPLGLATETDTAFAISMSLMVNLTLATETDTAFTVSIVKNLGLGLASETNTAIAIPRIKNIALGIASETDTAIAIPRIKNIPLGLATETDTAFAISVSGGSINVNVGTSSETDTAFTVSIVKNIALGLATETDTAITIPRVKNIPLTLATETNSALPIVIHKLIPITRADSTETGLAIPPAHHVAPGIASETDTAIAILGRKNVALGLATETDTAFTLGVNAVVVPSTRRVVAVGAYDRLIEIPAKSRTLTL